MSENLEKTENALRDLIETLLDGHKGFIELEKNLKDPEARQLFREETLVRANFAAELENELHHFGVKDVKVPSSTAGKVHRACRAGVARTFQIPRPFQTLTVADNVRAAARFGAAGRSAIVDDPITLCNLGKVLRDQGKYADLGQQLPGHGRVL